MKRTRFAIRAAKAEPKTLYVSRDLENSADFLAWAAAQGFESAFVPGELHVTIAFSKQPVDWDTIIPDDRPLEVPASDDRQIKQLGPEGEAVVLGFSSAALAARWQQIKNAGASWDYESYQPHVTITYNGEGIDLSTVEPYRGPLIFGPEKFNEISEGWTASVQEGRLSKAAATQKQLCRVVKIDEEQRMVYGWASVVSKNGVEVEDLHGDIIQPEVLEKAATQFMKEVRVGAEMHERDAKNQPIQKADIIHSFVLTNDIMKLLGISSQQEGWIIGAFIKDDALWAKYKSGEYPAFSIAGDGMFQPVEGS